MSATPEAGAGSGAMSALSAMSAMSAPPVALRAHWRSWLGAADDVLATLGRPSQGAPCIHVVGAATRERPGWDGKVHPVAGVVDPYGNSVVAVPGAVAERAAALVAGGGTLADVRAALPGWLGRPDGVVYRAVYRWAVRPVHTRPVGEWVPGDDPRLPEWLRPFGGPALVVLDGHDYVAGLGLKRHDGHAHEIAVGTSEAARGQGLARRLVARAARELGERGLAATYQHDPGNVASARVADAAGLPDQRWTALGLA